MLFVNSGLRASGSILFLDSFGVADGLITNEFAHWNPSSGSSKISPNWDMTSGSLFASGGTAWSGNVDNAVPNATSSNGTNSAIFRLNTKRFDFGDVKVSFRLLINSLHTTASTPQVDWDGIHIFLRYQSEYSLYYASVNRRDGHVLIKKKCAGGSSNGGTYYTISPEVTGKPIPFGSWQNVAASVQNNSNGSVTIRLYREGIEIVSATDSGTGCAPIRSAGATGIRGDNANFKFDNFTVESLTAASSTPSPTPTKTNSGQSGSSSGGSNAGGNAGGNSGSNSGGQVQEAANPTPSPTPTASVSRELPAPEDTAESNLGPLSPAVLTKAARTEPTFWAALTAGVLAIVLGALLWHDHNQTKAAVRRRRR
jgi:hypothetical protein